ncbi:MAG: hypothetical protein APF76_00590 [Desulfitibacter sp. BRH_c19]|nr:MAG: hypothetical protein APF76_00590 [Desulfitibacter sp. BRH_c19]
MSTIFNEIFIVTLIAASIRMAIPLLLAATGELIAERSGVVNISLEGQMLVGAFFGFIGTYFTGSLMFGAMVGTISGVLMSLVLNYMCVTLKTDQIIVGITLNIFALGITSYFYRVIFGITTTPPSVAIYKNISIPFLSKIPYLGPIVFEQSIIVYLSILIVIVVNIMLFKTSLGLKIRAAGEYPRAAETMGVNINKLRYLSVMLCGALAGLGGSYLSLGILGRFVDNLSAGRGFIALAIVIFGKWSPYKVLGAALLFGFADALQLRLQALGVQLPYQFMLMFPYAITIIAMIVTGKNSKAPQALSVPYDREKL